jgi:hypothetical protein
MIEKKISKKINRLERKIFDATVLKMKSKKKIEEACLNYLK